MARQTLTIFCLSHRSQTHAQVRVKFAKAWHRSLCKVSIIGSREGYVLMTTMTWKSQCECDCLSACVEKGGKSKAGVYLVPKMSFLAKPTASTTVSFKTFKSLSRVDIIPHVAVSGASSTYYVHELSKQPGFSLRGTVHQLQLEAGLVPQYFSQLAAAQEESSVPHCLPSSEQRRRRWCFPSRQVEDLC